MGGGQVGGIDGGVLSGARNGARTRMSRRIATKDNIPQGRCRIASGELSTDRGFVGLLTCLQIARDARVLPADQPKGSNR